MADKTSLERIEEKQDEILKILNGNGKVGLVAKVTIMWNSIIWLIILVVGTAYKTFLQ